MKTTKTLWFFAAGLLLLTTACSGNEETAEENGENQEQEACTTENDVFFLVENYGYRYDSTYMYNGDFEVVRTEYTMENDSTATISLFNYEQGKSGENNHEIRIELHAKNGNKIKPGVYPYHDYYSDLYCSTTIDSDKGRVYFNWNAGMPKQGHVELIHADADHACGKLQLRVDKKDSKTIGHVELGGTWKAEK